MQSVVNIEIPLPMWPCNIGTRPMLIVIILLSAETFDLKLLSADTAVNTRTNRGTKKSEYVVNVCKSE